MSATTRVIVVHRRRVGAGRGDRQPLRIRRRPRGRGRHRRAARAAKSPTTSPRPGSRPSRRPSTSRAKAKSRRCSTRSPNATDASTRWCARPRSRRARRSSTAPTKSWQQVLDVNLKGPFLCCKHGIPAIAGSGGGAVVLLGSVLGAIGSPGYAAVLRVEGRARQPRQAGRDRTRGRRRAGERRVAVGHRRRTVRRPASGSARPMVAATRPSRSALLEARAAPYSQRRDHRRSTADGRPPHRLTHDEPDRYQGSRRRR